MWGKGEFFVMARAVDGGSVQVNGRIVEVDGGSVHMDGDFVWVFWFLMASILALAKKDAAVVF